MGKHWKVLNTELTSSDLHLTGSFWLLWEFSLRRHKGRSRESGYEVTEIIETGHDETGARVGHWGVIFWVSPLYKWHLKPGERMSSLGERIQPTTEGWALQHLEDGEMRMTQWKTQRRNSCEGRCKCRCQLKKRVTQLLNQIRWELRRNAWFQQLGGHLRLWWNGSSQVVGGEKGECKTIIWKTRRENGAGK